MNFKPTDANGIPLKSTPLPEIIETLTKFTKEELVAVAAIMSVVLFEYNWKEQLTKFQEALQK